MYIRTCIHTCIHTYIHMYIHTYVHTYMYIYTYLYTYVHTVFIRIEARAFISYKWLLTRHLYEPLLDFTWVFIFFRVLNPGVYLGPGIYMSPASIRINTVYVNIRTYPWYVTGFGKPTYHLRMHKDKYLIIQSIISPKAVGLQFAT